MNIGYHYTPLAFYIKHICRDGLIPNLLDEQNRKELSEDLGDLDSVIWIFFHKYKGVKLLGTLIERAYTHNYTQFVCLKIWYKDSEAISHDIRVKYTGVIGNALFHDNEPVNLLTATIPPKRIKVVNYYNILEAIKCRLKNDTLPGLETEVFNIKSSLT